jgi:hypothetical protein
MLVAPDKEPITPFIAKVEALFHQHGVSSILVIGAWRMPRLDLKFKS